MNPREQQILHAYFKSHVQVFLIFAAVFACLFIHELICVRVTSAIFFILVFLVIILLFHGTTFYFWLRVRKELNQKHTEQKVITIQKVEIDHFYSLYGRFNNLVGDPKLILTDEHGDSYRLVVNKSVPSWTYRSIEGETMELCYLPETRLLLSAVPRTKERRYRDVRQSKKDLKSFLGFYLK